MTLHVVPIPDPPAGTDFQAYVPGRYFYDVTGLTATLTTPVSPITVMHDSSGNANNGTYVPKLGHFPASVAGLVAGNAAIQWDTFAPNTSSSGQITVPTLDWRGDFTIEGWIRQDPAHPFDGYMVTAVDAGTLGKVALFYGATGALQLVKESVPQEVHETAVGSVPVDGNPHYIVVTYTAATVRFYIDGVLTAQTVNDPHRVMAANAVGVRFNWSRFGQTSGGYIQDETAVYGHALTAARVTAHLAAAAVSFAAYVAAVLTDTPAGYYHLDEGSASGREPSLVISDGTHDVEVIPPGFPAVATPGPYRYSWTPALNADTQSSDGTLTTVATGPIRVPGGYTIGTRTLDIQPGDQWSNVVLQWDDQYMMSLPEFNPYNYPPGANLIFQQIGAGP